MATKDKKLIKDNLEIAEFKGWYNTTPEDPDFDFYQHPTEKTIHGSTICDQWGFDYDCSWDWLMPVVDYIRQLDFMVSIDNHKTVISRLNLDSASGIENIVVHHVNTVEKEQDRIRVTYSAVLEFARWYKRKNSNKIS